MSVDGDLSRVGCGVLSAPATVRAILSAGSAATSLVMPICDGRGGHPIYVPRARFAELLALAPELGLRALVTARPDQVVRLPVDDPGVLRDFDTPEQLG